MTRTINLDDLEEVTAGDGVWPVTAAPNPIPEPGSSAAAESESRRKIQIEIRRCDARHIVRSLQARATCLSAKRYSDPVLLGAANREADDCRRLACLLTEAMKGSVR